MKVLKREIIYTCEFEWTRLSGKKETLKIQCNNKGELKSLPGIATRTEWEEISKEVKKQFRNKRSV